MADSNSPQIGLRISSDPDTTKIEQPQTQHAKKRVDLPLRLLFVADLTPQAAPDWSATSRVVSVDKHTFADLFRSFAPRLTLEVPNHISDAPKTLDVALTFDGLKGFHPAHVARQVPALNQLLEIRTLVADVQDKRIDLDTFRAKLEATGIDAGWAGRLYETLAAPPSAPKPKPRRSEPAADPSLDRLFGMIDTGDGDAAVTEPPADAPAGIADALVGALAGAPDTKPKVEQSAAAVLLDDLDDLLARQVDAILTHPSFRRLEAAWRGLKLLVDRLDFRRGVRLDVLAASKPDLAEALYHQVLLPEHETEDPDHVAPAALILDHLFDHSAADLELLTDLAETAASLQVPCIAGVGAGFFGIAAPTGLDKLPMVTQHLDGPQYIAYQKLRERPEAAHLALAVPPLLLRPAYGERQPVEAFAYAETGQLWGSGALAVAVAMGRSFAETGWPTHLAGTAAERIEDLPVWKAPAGLTPLAALLGERKQAELGDAGFVVLSGRPDRDVVYLTRAPTVARPKHHGDPDADAESAAHASLPCRLFMARAAQFLLRFQSDLAPGTDPVDAEVELRQRLSALLRKNGEALPDAAIHIQYMPEASTDTYEVLAVRLQPPGHVLDYPVRLMLGVQVPKAQA